MEQGWEEDGDWILQRYLDSISKLEHEILCFTAELESQTPRPDPTGLKNDYGGELCNESITAALPALLVQELQDLKASFEKIEDKLPLDMLTDSEEEDDDCWVDQPLLPTRGTGPEVPACLRAEHPIVNEHYGKGQTERAIREYWSHKKHRHSELKDQSPLDVLQDFLFRKYRDQDKVVSTAYNLVSCSVLNTDLCLVSA